MNAEQLKGLQIRPELKSRPQKSLWIIFLGVAVCTGIAVYFAWLRTEDGRRLFVRKKDALTNAAAAAASATPASLKAAAAASTEGAVLTVSGYIVNRERIELSPRFLGQVK